MSFFYVISKQLIFLLLKLSRFNGIVHPKINLLKMYSLSGHPRCRWVCFFIWTDLEKCSITAVAHQWILCSEWVPSEWESKQLIKTSQNFTSNPHNSSPSINIFITENLHVCNLKPLLPAKIWVLYPKYCFLQWKTVSSESGEIKHHLPVKSVQKKLFYTIMLVDFDVREQQEMDFVTGGRVIDYGQKQWFKVQML